MPVKLKIPDGLKVRRPPAGQVFLAKHGNLGDSCVLWDEGRAGRLLRALGRGKGLEKLRELVNTNLESQDLQVTGHMWQHLH